MPVSEPAAVAYVEAPRRHSASVVVCVYTAERWDQIEAAIESLDKQRRSPAEIAVVVDHNPALFERLQEAHPELIVIENVHERGLSGARNTGVEATSGDVVVFLDDDARADAAWLDAMLSSFDEDPRVAGAGGLVVPEWTDRAPSWFPEEFLWVIGCSYRGLPTDTADVRNPIGASMAFRRSAFETAGPFDASVGRNASSEGPMGCEETLLSLRVREALPDARIVHEPRSVAYHSVPTSRGTWRYFLARCYAEGISKRQVASSVTSKDALGVERGYVLGTLTSGVALAAKDFVRHPAWPPLGRIAAIGLGLLATTAGYLRGAVGRR
jgi:GT2 family glycosyltransferase